MTPYQLELHAQHKARQQRINSAAIEHQARTGNQIDKEQRDLIEKEMLCVSAIESKAATKEPWFKIEAVEQIDRRHITIEEIQIAVCSFYDIPRYDLIGDRRTKNVVLPRHIGMYLCRELTSRSHPMIGRHFGGRDHTVSLFACAKITRLIEENERVRTDVAKLRSILDPFGGRDA